MDSVGIIAEYNPFHNGHLYQLKKVKEMFPNMPVVLVLAGNFTQRGDVSIIDKWKKTDIAIKAGIDLVIELPFSFSTQSADFFSYGAITILEKLKVKYLVFGTESDELSDIELLVDTQLNNKDFSSLVKIYSKLGNNYPTSMSLALKDLTGKSIKTPNDLLAISYIKTIRKNNYNIKPICIKRTNDYHDETLDKNISSATSIRIALKNNIDIKGQVPEFVIPYLNDLHFIDDYFELLKYKIITDDNLSNYQGVDEGLENILKKEIMEANNFDELVKRIKSKRYTYNNISRMLIHILCNLKKCDMNEFNTVKYIRLLGFNDIGKRYLNKIKKDIDIPIISKISREKDRMLEFEIQTTKIYALTDNNSSKLLEKEFKNRLLKGENI